jgi:hypothetical protein
MKRLRMLAGVALLALFGCESGTPTEPQDFAVEGRVALASLISLSDGHLVQIANHFQILANSEVGRSADWERIRPFPGAVEERSVRGLFWFALPDGSYWSMQHGKEAGNLSDRRYWPRLMAGQRVLGDLVVSRATGKSSAIVAVPVHDAGGTIVVVLGSSIFLDSLSVQLQREIDLQPHQIFFSIEGTPQIHAGNRHTCALNTAGQAYCWGWNTYGQLGDGTTCGRYTPTAVSGSLTFAQLGTRGLHTCALTPSGQAYCWGHNADGQLGDGTTTGRYTPTAVSGGLTFAQLGAGLYHICGVGPSGSANCWGSNSFGQLGDGTTIQRRAPAMVGGGFAFAQVTGGGTFTWALTGAGAAYCWGRNNAGQLGDGTQTDRHVPSPVAGGLAFAQISAGSDYACARTARQAGYCWGSNS